MRTDLQVSLIRSLALLVVVLSLTFVSSCAQTSTRRGPSPLTPKERVDQKLSMLRTHDSRLTPSQKVTFMHDPGLTRAELERTVEAMVTYNETLRRAAASRVSVGDVRRAHGESSPYVTETDGAAEDFELPEEPTSTSTSTGSESLFPDAEVETGTR